MSSCSAIVNTLPHRRTGELKAEWANELKNWLLFVFLWHDFGLTLPLPLPQIKSYTISTKKNGGTKQREFLMAYGCRARKQHLCHRTHRAKCIYVECWLFSGGDGDTCRLEKNGTHVTISKTHHHTARNPNKLEQCVAVFFRVAFLVGFSVFFAGYNLLALFCCCWTEPKGVASEMPLAQFVALPF